MPTVRSPLSATKELIADEDAERLRQIARFVQQRRRLARVRLGVVSVSIVIGFLGAALVLTHTATPTAEPPPVIGTNTMAIPGGESVSPAITQSTPASTGSADMTVPPDRPEGSPAPAAPEKSLAVALAHRRASDNLTFAVPGKSASSNARRDETFTLGRPAAPQSKTMLGRATTLSASDRRSGSVRSVGSDRLVVAEFGRGGEEQQLQVTITRKTRIIESQRNPAASDAHDSFIEKTISLAEVKTGDYVVVDASRQETKLVAESVTVTLRKSDPSLQARP